jgi:hypothetical protein
MPQTIETAAFVASFEELCRIAPGWQAPRPRRERVTDEEHPFADDAANVGSALPREPFPSGTPTSVDLSALAHEVLGDLDLRWLDRLGASLLSAANEQAARAIDVPLFGPPAPETDGLLRLARPLVQALARLDPDQLTAHAERWAERRAQAQRRQPTASAVERWEDQAHALAEMSRHAAQTDKAVLLRLAFGPKRSPAPRSYERVHFARTDFHPLFLRLTRTAQDALVRARHFAPDARHRVLRLDHVLASLLDDDGSDVALHFAHHGFARNDVRPILVEGSAPRAATTPSAFDPTVLGLLVDTFELHGFASRLLRIRSADLLEQLLGDPAHYLLDWLPKRLKTVASKTPLRFVRLPESARENAEARVPPPV